MFRNYILRLTLTNFVCSRVIDIENEDGVSERGVFIPLDINGLHVTDRGNVSSHFFVTERMRTAIDGGTHYVKMKINKDALNRMNELGYENPYVGDMRPTSIKPSYQSEFSKTGGRVKSSDYFNDKE